MITRKYGLLALLAAVCAVVLILAAGIGSVPVAPADTANVILNKLFGIPLSSEIDEITRSILLKIRIPRALLAFISGSGLAVSGVIMQSVLRNPLASSYTLGVSSGAALGASTAILLGISVFGQFTLPFFGLTAGLLTVFLALGLASKIDRNFQNNSIILTGMAFSLFANAMITIAMSFSKDQLQRIVFWQMGSFAMKSPQDFLLLLPVILPGFVIAIRYAREMDVMTLGDEQAQVSGVESKKMKWMLLSVSAVMTGAIVSVAGVIGFIDLFIPHAMRKLFGARHRYLIVASALSGGAFMTLCDLVARTAFAPYELPVGAITSAVGAPFFIFLYFSKRKK